MVVHEIAAGRPAEATSPPWRTWALGWAGVAACGFVNGALHRAYGPWLEEQHALALSEVLLPALVVPWALWFERRHPLSSTRDAVRVGVAWAGTTVAFELVFGHYVNGDSWSALIGAYDLPDGRLWALDVAVIAAAPLLARSWRTRRTPAAADEGEGR